MKPRPVVQVLVTCFEDGSMSVQGPIEDKVWMMACLENAMDAVRNHGKPTRDIIVPEKDVRLSS